MRLSSLYVAVVLLFSVATFAQHSSAGGGSSSSGSSSGSSGGGSHSGSSGGSSSSASSGGGHTSAGSGSSSSAHSSAGSGSGSGSSSSAQSSGGFASHVSSVHSPGSVPTSSRSSVSDSLNRVQNNHVRNDHVRNDHVQNNLVQNNVRSIREPNTGTQGRTQISEKRSFFSFLRHPFRKPEPNPPAKTKPVADLRRPVCLRGPCTLCPNGQARVGGACGAAVVPTSTQPYCSFGEIWNGGSCLLQTRFLDDCAALRMTMLRQEQRMRVAESRQQSACAAGSSQFCLDSASAAQSEADLYWALQVRYQRCMQHSIGTYPFVGFGFRGYSSGLLFEPLEMDFEYP